MKNILKILFVIIIVSLLSVFANAQSENKASVKEFLVAPSRYTNRAPFGIGIENTINGRKSVVSLGNFGGYVIYEFEKPIFDRNNNFGIDFIVNGNAFNGGAGAAEPGQVWVSRDGKNWFAIAGSEHYEDQTVWDYSVTYAKTDNENKCDFTDSLGDFGAVSSKTASPYPKSEFYPNATIPENNLTLSGILISKMRTPSTENIVPTAFGYVDSKSANDSNVPSDPYLENPEKNCNDGRFDISLAVDKNGLPVSLKWIKYIKVQTATFIDSSVFGEKSTEITALKIARENRVEVENSPVDAILFNGKSLDLSKGNVINIRHSGAFEIKVEASNSNVYINNSHTKEKHFESVGNKGVVRILVRKDDCAPSIFFLNFTDKTTSARPVLLKNSVVFDNLFETVQISTENSKLISQISSDENVAIIENGTVVPIGDGECTIFVSNENGQCASCKVVVKTTIETNCKCRCHKTSGILKFIWKIELFFIKLFQTRQICECNIAHY